MAILIRNAEAVLPDGKVEQKDIVIEKDKIRSITDSADSETPYEKIIEGRGMLAIPGFVNAHTHAAMTLLRSYADDMSLMDWLNNKIWPVEAKMKREDIYWGSMLAALEMIQSGTTAFADMYGPCMEEVARVTEESGLRGVLSQGLIGVAPDGDKKLESNISLYENCHGKADGRITVMLGPHAIYTCPPEYLKKVNAAAERLGAEIHIHMSETLTEVEDCVKAYGKRPFAVVEETGLFEHGTLAAHCVHLSDHEIEIMKKHGIRPAHNPGSNMKLASGTAPVPRLLKEGIHVALGTDGASSNNNLDMLEEVTLAALLHKVDTLDPVAVPAFRALQMGTEYGAEALSLKDCGRLEEGRQADIVLIKMKGAAWCPAHQPVSQLVYAANSSSVDTVMVAGKVLMEGREFKTLDEERILFEANRCAERLTK